MIDISKKMTEIISKIFETHRIIHTLKKTGLFTELKNNQLKSIAKIADHLTIKANALIINEGDLADNFYIITSGVVEIFVSDSQGNEVMLTHLEKNGFFGEQALLEAERGKRNASARALTDVTLLSISHANFTRILHATKKLKTMLIEIGQRELIHRLSRQLIIFHSLSNDMITNLAGNILEYKNDDVIFHKGDQPDFTYYIISGEIKIILDETKSATHTLLKQGQIFGEVAILKKQPRAATALSAGTTRLLRIQPIIFHHLYIKTPELRELIGVLHEIYQSPNRGGVVTQFNGKYLNYDTINTTFNLTNNRTILTSRFIKKSIFNISVLHIINPQIIRYEYGNLIREIRLKDRIIVGAMAVGHWNCIGQVCNAILDGQIIEPELLSNFKRTGDLTFQKNSNIILCHCMKISRNDIIAIIHSGKSNIDDISEATGAGTVCGSCRPNLYDLLGKNAWSFAYLSNIKILNPNVKSFQLKLRNDEYVSYQPGQYITLGILINGNWFERSYTLTSDANTHDYYEITVKRENGGALSSWLFDHDTDPLLLIKISSPQGQFILDGNQQKNPVVFFAGGIGVTPALAFARNMLSSHHTYPFHLDYSANTAADFICIDEFNEIHKNNPLFTFKTRNSADEGFLSELKIKESVVNFPCADFYLCGPTEFIKLVKKVLLSLNITESKIHEEFFTGTDNH